MSHAAKPYGPTAGGTYVGKAASAWSEVPDWVMELARACDAVGSMSAVARLLGYSAAVLSQVLCNKYPGRYDRVEAKVRGVLMQAAVYCPGAGMTIARSQCADWQRCKKPSSASPLAAKFPGACRGCPNAFGGSNA